MNFKTLQAWQEYIWTLHTTEIDLGLVRVREVAERLNLCHFPCPVITVGGTNGKGSCVAGIESIYLAAGYSVGSFTSPYLFRLNEEFKVGGKPVKDDVICQAFAKIEAVRGTITLTPFEFNTVAALEIFREANLDVIVLEVGLGGRLDAVNILGADVSVITSIAIDHADRLGDTRELIAREKAGIFRANKPAVCGDEFPPESLVHYAKELHTPLYCQGKEFTFLKNETTWYWQSQTAHLENLPLTSLALQNMSTVLMTIELMQQKLPVKREAIVEALASIMLPGRIEIIPGVVTTIIDVSHNPAAAELLAKKLEQLPCHGKTRAVFSMLADKDILSTLQNIQHVIDDWYVGELSVPRKASAAVLQEALHKANIKKNTFYPNIAKAYQAAQHESRPGDRVVVFGSFYTVAESGCKVDG